MVAPLYHEQDWPLFRVVLPRTELDDGEFMAFVDTLDRLPLRGTFALLIDARVAPPLAPKRRQILAERGNASHERHPGVMVGMAVVLSSALQRGVHTAIHWMMRQRHHIRAFGSVSEAEAWLRGCLHESATRSRASRV